MPINSSGHRSHKGRRSFIALVRIVRNFRNAHHFVLSTSNSMNLFIYYDVAVMQPLKSPSIYITRKLITLVSWILQTQLLNA